MDADRFDSLSKFLSLATTRRGIVRLLATLPLGMSLTALRGAEVDAERPVDRVRRRAEERQQRRQNSRGGDGKENDDGEQKRKNKDKDKDKGLVHRPVAVSGNSFSGDEGIKCLQVRLIGSDDKGHPLSFVIVTEPEHGELSDMNPPQVTATTQALCYRPFDGFHGTDGFTYQADDGIRRSEVATIDIEIRDIN